MSEIALVKKRATKRNPKITNNEKYINHFLSRFLIAVIIFLSCLIFSNFSNNFKEFIQTSILKDNISFTHISNIYNKYFGTIIPLKEVGKEETTVFNEKITYQKLTDYKDGYELSVTENYLVPVINSGIVVFIGEKEGYGKTIIIQGIDEIDYWYGNVDNISVSLYDYATEGTLLASTKSNKLYLAFQKKGKYLDYGEVME